MLLDALEFILINSFANWLINPFLSCKKYSVLFILALITFENLPRPALNKQEAAQPFEALGQMLIFKLFCLCGAKYKI